MSKIWVYSKAIYFLTGGLIGIIAVTIDPGYLGVGLLFLGIMANAIFYSYVVLPYRDKYFLEHRNDFCKGA